MRQDGRYRAALPAARRIPLAAVVPAEDAARGDRQVRALALDRPDLVRPGAPLPFSPRKIHDHWEALIAQGRMREAETFGKRFPQAIAQARPRALAEREAARVESERREWLAYRRLDALTRARHAVAEETKYLDAVSQGRWPPYMRKDASEVPTARHVTESRVRLASKQADLARLEAEDAAAATT